MHRIVRKITINKRLFMKKKDLQKTRTILVAIMLVFLTSSKAYSQIENRQPLPFTIENNTEFPDNEVFVAIVGEDLTGPPGMHIWVDCKTGNQYPMDRSLNTVPGPVYVWLGVPGEPGIPARNDIEGNRNPDGTAKYADCFSKLSDIPNKTVMLQPMQGTRVFISAKEQLYLFFFGPGPGAESGYTAPSPTDPTDPNQGILFEMIELTYDKWGYFANTTRVDSYKYPIGMEVWGDDTTFINPQLPRPQLTDPSNIKEIGKHYKVGEIRTHEEIIAEWEAYAPEEFHGCLNPETGEITAPSKTLEFADGSVGTMPVPGPYVDYLKPYIDAIWSKYANEDLFIYTGDAGYWKGKVEGDRLVMHSQSDVNGPFYGRTGVINGKPTTQEVLEGKGLLDNVVDDRTVDLMIQAQICAAINRHVVDISTPNVGLQDWSNSNEYYQESPANFYSKFWHRSDISLNGRSYGFCYDDVWDQSSSCPTIHPTKVVVSFGGYPDFVEDTIKPSQPANLVAEPQMTTVMLSWDASTDNIGVEGYNIYNGNEFIGATVNTSFLVENLISNTDYVFDVEAFDKAGNDSEKASVTTKTLDCGDDVAPSNPVNLSGNSTETSIAINWGAASDNIGVIGYNIFRDDLFIVTITELSYSETGLESGKTYNYSVEAFDACGNKSEKAQVSITTKFINKCTGSSSGLNSTSFDWEASNESFDPTITFIPGEGVGTGLCILHYTVGNGAQQNVNVSMNQPYPITANQGEEVIFYYTYSRSSGGEDNSMNNKASFIVGDCGPVDIEAPTVPADLIIIPGNNYAQLSWDASTDNVGVAGYSVYLNGILVATTSALEYTIEGLDYNTTYDVAVDAFDAAGNFSAKSEVVFTTLPCGDDIAPGLPTDIVTVPYEKSIDVSWTAANDNIGVVGYNIYQDNELIGVTTEINYTLVNLQPITTYQIKIEAFDACGNTSEASISETTLDQQNCSGSCQGLNATSFDWEATSDNINPGITFIPGEGVGNGLCILHYTIDNGAQLNVNVTMNEPYYITANPGQVVEFYYTYARSAGGEDNSMNDKASFVVGECGSSLKTANQSTEIETIKLDDMVTIYPNPVAEQLNVKFEASFNKFQLINMNGAVITEKEICNENKLSIDISSVKSGFYFIYLSGNKGNVMKKIIKK